MLSGTGLVIVAILGLIIGSFLNVVIWRLPIMLHRLWSNQSQSYLQDHGLEVPPLKADEPFNLVVPRSRCPHCGHPIGALENIPVLSFLFLKGRCKNCQQPIAWRYPIIEITTAVFSLLTAYHFGYSWQTVAALLFTWSLIALTVIDIDHHILPDDITLPLLWLGLAVNVNSLFVPLPSAVIGAMVGYLFLWGVYWLFKLLTGKEGMGYGDFKLLAALGAWLGWKALPMIVLLSSFVGAIAGILLIALKRHNRAQPIPFGPFLALAGWISLLWGDKIYSLYVSFIYRWIA